jgi:hypothetical protein
VSAEGSNAGGHRRGRRPHGQTILRGRYDGEFDRTNLVLATWDIRSQTSRLD